MSSLDTGPTQCVCTVVLQEYINKNPNQRLCRVPKRHKLGDGMCDRTSDAAGYNTKVCGWDGGDCCTMSCSRGGHMFSCHHSRMQCLDPQFLVCRSHLQ